jgi:hypothetical protein
MGLLIAVQTKVTFSVAFVAMRKLPVRRSMKRYMASMFEASVKRRCCCSMTAAVVVARDSVSLVHMASMSVKIGLELARYREMGDMFFARWRVVGGKKRRR